MEFTRNCPKCEQTLRYVSQKNKERADLNKSLCKSCDRQGRAVLNLIGQQFGQLTVKEQVQKRDSNGNCYWRCECFCGGTALVRTANLRRGDVQSCGCKRLGIPRKYPHPKMRKRPFEALYNRLKNNRARYYDIPVLLTYEEFLEFTKINECHYCGEPVIWTKYNLNNRRSCATNLDRKNNLLGYSTDNCVVSCLPCNKTKGNRFTYEEFKAMMHALKEYRHGTKALKAAQ
jgi:hypothetical protein